MNNNFENKCLEVDKIIKQLTNLYSVAFKDGFQPEKFKNMKPIQVNVLTLVGENPNISVKAVTEILKAPNSTITSVLNKLENDSMLKRKIDKEDKRTFLLKLTNKGRQYIECIELERQQFYHYLLGHIEAEDDRDQLLKLLTKLMETINPIDLQALRRIRMNAVRKEYEEFGPWLVPIINELDIPQQFMHYKEDIMGELYAFKIPRDIEFRDAEEGIPLYDSVVVLTEKMVKIFKRIDNSINLSKMAYTDIKEFQFLDCLLFSEIIISSDSEDLVLEYNPSYRKVVENFIDIIRSKFVEGDPVLNIENIGDELHITNYFFRSQLEELSSRENIKMLYFQDDIEILKGDVPKSLLLKDFIHEPILEATAIVTNGKELIILSRMKEIRDKADTDYGYKYSYIPLKDINSIECVEDELVGGFNKMLITSGNKLCEVRVTKGCSVQGLKELLNS